MGLEVSNDTYYQVECSLRLLEKKDAYHCCWWCFVVFVFFTIVVYRGGRFFLYLYWVHCWGPANYVDKEQIKERKASKFVDSCSPQHMEYLVRSNSKKWLELGLLGHLSQER